MLTSRNPHRAAFLSLQPVEGKKYITKEKGTVFILCIQKMRIAFQRPECAPSTREHSSFHLQKVKHLFMLKPFICETTAGVT